MKDTKDIKTLADLTPDGENFNKHTEFGTKLLEDSLRKFGAGRSVLVDKDGNIIAGNGVVETAAGIGMDDVVVVQTDGKKLVVVQRTDLELDSPEGRELALADNMTALKGIDIDLDKVRESLGDDLAKAWGMEIPEPQRTATEDDFDPDKPVETVCKKGDIWKLGNHRLMCGDSTDAGSVALLMDGEKADIAFSSPPYNAGFGKCITKDNGRSKYTNGDDDNKPQAEYEQFLTRYIENATENAEYNFVNIQMLANNKHALLQCIASHSDTLADIIVWDKQRSQPAAAVNVLNSEFEFVFVFSKKGTRAIGVKPFHGTLKNIVHIPPQKNEFSDEHNAVFPMELPSHFVNSFSEKSVLDLFGGSGTTLIAAEQLNRRCYMMELDPHYCDVIIARYEKLTGNKAERISNGNE